MDARPLTVNWAVGCVSRQGVVDALAPAKLPQSSAGSLGMGCVMDRQQLRFIVLPFTWMPGYQLAEGQVTQPVLKQVWHSERQLMQGLALSIAQPFPACLATGCAQSQFP